MPLTQVLNDCKVIPLNPMARGRIISQSISNSRKVAGVSDQAALLFTWIQPHTDDFGRVEGGADDVLFSIVPRRGWQVEQVEQYLKELWVAQLVKSYHDETGKRYLEVVGFEEHQTFRSDRGRKAKCPAPVEYDSQWYTSGNQWEKTDTEVKLSEVKVKLSKVKVKPKAPVGKPTETAPKEETVKPLTPKDKALQFFEGVEALKNKQSVPWLQEFLNAIAQKNNKVSKQAIWSEIVAFANYWTELTHTGTRQRWQCQKTFEVDRRLLTWFNRAGFKGFSTSVAGSGNKGKNIIGLDEDENAEQQ